MPSLADGRSAPPGLVALAWANLAVVFAVELAGLAAYALWGASAVSPMWGRWALAFVVPLVAAVVWGLFCAPRAVILLPSPVVVLLKEVMLTAAALALVNTSHPYAAAALVIVACLTALVARSLPDPTL